MSILGTHVRGFAPAWVSLFSEETEYPLLCACPLDEGWTFDDEVEDVDDEILGGTRSR